VNLWIKTPDLKSFSHMYRQAWHVGLKTTYYLRSLGASNIEKATVSIKKEVRGHAGAAESGSQPSALSLKARRRLPPSKSSPAASKRCATAVSARPASKRAPYPNLGSPELVRGFFVFTRTPRFKRQALNQSSEQEAISDRVASMCMAGVDAGAI